MNKDISVLIGTCDKYSILWDNFVTLFDKYWEIDCNKLFVSENYKKNYDGYDFYLPGNLNWSNRIISSLETITTEYTFFVLEDYYFTETLSKEEIEFHLEYMKETSANKVMLDCKSRHMLYCENRPYRGKNLYRVHETSSYLTSVQPSIWKTSYLKECLIPDWSPWDFEIIGSLNRRHKEKNTYLMAREKLTYWNAVRKGLKLSPGWQEIKNKENLKDFLFGEKNVNK